MSQATKIAGPLPRAVDPQLPTAPHFNAKSRFLIDSEHSGVDRWVHVEPDEVWDLVDELGVGRDLELVLAPRLEPERPPDLRHGLVADPVLGAAKDRVDQCVASTGALSKVSITTCSTTSSRIERSSGTGLVDEPVEAPFGEAVAPLRDRRRVTPPPDRRSPGATARGPRTPGRSCSASPRTARSNADAPSFRAVVVQLRSGRSRRWGDLAWPWRSLRCWQ